MICVLLRKFSMPYFRMSFTTFIFFSTNLSSKIFKFSYFLVLYDLFFQINVNTTFIMYKYIISLKCSFFFSFFSKILILLLLLLLSFFMLYIKYKLLFKFNLFFLIIERKNLRCFSFL